MGLQPLGPTVFLQSIGVPALILENRHGRQGRESNEWDNGLIGKGAKMPSAGSEANTVTNAALKPDEE